MLADAISDDFLNFQYPTYIASPPANAAERPSKVEAIDDCFSMLTLNTKNNVESTWYSCNFKIKFTYDTDKVHIFSVNTTDLVKKYDVDENIPIYYDVNDPTTEPSIEQIYSTYIYLAMIVIGVLGCVKSISSIYFANKYDFVAQAQGVKSGLELGNYAFSPLFGVKR